MIIVILILIGGISNKAQAQHPSGVIIHNQSSVEITFTPEEIVYDERFAVDSIYQSNYTQEISFTLTSNGGLYYHRLDNYYHDSYRDALSPSWNLSSADQFVPKYWPGLTTELLGIENYIYQEENTSEVYSFRVECIINEATVALLRMENFLSDFSTLNYIDVSQMGADMGNMYEYRYTFNKDFNGLAYGSIYLKTSSNGLRTTQGITNARLVFKDTFFDMSRLYDRYNLIYDYKWNFFFPENMKAKPIEMVDPYGKSINWTTMSSGNVISIEFDSTAENSLYEVSFELKPHTKTIIEQIQENYLNYLVSTFIAIFTFLKSIPFVKKKVISPIKKKIFGEDGEDDND